MPNNHYFVFDGKLCKAEGMTKEQIINAIVQATGTLPSDIDAGFISTIVEQNKSNSIHFWYGTQAEYDAMESHDKNTFYIIDGDASFDDLEAAIINTNAELAETKDVLEAFIDAVNAEKEQYKDFDSLESLRTALTIGETPTRIELWEFLGEMGVHYYIHNCLFVLSTTTNDTPLIETIAILQLSGNVQVVSSLPSDCFVRVYKKGAWDL